MNLPSPESIQMEKATADMDCLLAGCFKVPRTENARKQGEMNG